jgi:predicted dehydrogenase
VGHLERFNPAFSAAKKMVRHPVLIESSRKCSFKQRGTDVSVVLDMMIHDIDLLLSLVPSEITELKAAGMRLASGFLDVANVHIRFAAGCVANLSASRIASASERRMDIFQPDARIAIDFTDPTVTIVRKKEAFRAESDDMVSMETRSLPKRDALQDELAAFVRSVTTREKPEVSGEMGRNALQTALDIMAQIEGAEHSASKG